MRREEMARKEEIFNNPMIMKKLYDDLVSSNPKSKVKKSKKDRKEKSSKRDKKKRSSSGEKSASKRSKPDDSRSRSRSVDFDSDTDVTFPILKISRGTSPVGNPQNTKPMLLKPSANLQNPTKKAPKNKKTKKSGPKATSHPPKSPHTPQTLTPTLPPQKPKKIYYSMITSENGLALWSTSTKKPTNSNFSSKKNSKIMIKEK
jgi:hypothetical protein